MQPLEPKPNRSGLIWNSLSLLLVILIMGLVAFFVIIFIDPGSALNPFPPIPLPTLMSFPNGDITPSSASPATQSTVSVIATQTASLTLVPSPTPMQTWTTVTPGNPSDPSGMPFQTTIDHVVSTYYHPEAGCNWMGVAGQVVDINNAPLQYLGIHIYGTLAGTAVDYTSVSGTAPIYGKAGFEFYLGDQALASSNSLTIQLTDQQNLPLSEPIPLVTFSDCSKNLVLIRFKQVR